MIQQYVLTQGPSREQLFDALRLGGSHPALSIVEFWGKARTFGGGESGSLLPIQIEGLQRLQGEDDRQWWFWGNRRQTTSKAAWEGKVVCYVCGGWNAHQRRGFMRLSSEPFWISPFGEGPLNGIIANIEDGWLKQSTT